MDFFDSNSNRQLDATEFSHIILPCEDNDVRKVILDRNQENARVGKNQRLSVAIENGLTKILQGEISLQRTLEKLKQDLAYHVDYTPAAAFRTIDGNSNELAPTRVIDTGNMDRFLRSHGHIATDLELLAIIRRMDTNGSMTIDLEEFEVFLADIQQIAKYHPK